MKKIILAIFCCFSLQIHGMFSFYWKDTSAKKIAETEALKQRAEGLLVKNATNIMLKSYLDTLKTPTTPDNCNQRKSHLQTLLFPCNTNIAERVLASCQQNIPEQAESWLRPWNWYKKPLQMCANVGQEAGAIVQDAKDSLKFSDYVCAGAGLIVADSLVRRNSDNFWLTALATPLYVAVPLTAVLVKKSGWDLYPVNHASLLALQQQGDAARHNLQENQRQLEEVQARNVRLDRYVTHANGLRRSMHHQLQREQQLNRDVQSQNNRFRHEQLHHEIARRQQNRQLQSIEQDRIRLQEQNAQLQSQLEQARARQQEQLLQSFLNSENMAQRARDLTSDSQSVLSESNSAILTPVQQPTVRRTQVNGSETGYSVSSRQDRPVVQALPHNCIVLPVPSEYNCTLAGLNQPNMNNTYPHNRTSLSLSMQVPSSNRRVESAMSATASSASSTATELLRNSASGVLKALNKIPK